MRVLFFKRRIKKITTDFDFDTLKERLFLVDEKAVFEEDIAVFKPKIRKYPMPKANRTLLKAAAEN